MEAALMCSRVGRGSPPTAPPKENRGWRKTGVTTATKVQDRSNNFIRMIMVHVNVCCCLIATLVRIIAV